MTRQIKLATLLVVTLALSGLARAQWDVRTDSSFLDSRLLSEHNFARIASPKSSFQPRKCTPPEARPFGSSGRTNPIGKTYKAKPRMSEGSTTTGRRRICGTFCYGRASCLSSAC